MTVLFTQPAVLTGCLPCWGWHEIKVSARCSPDMEVTRPFHGLAYAFQHSGSVSLNRECAPRYLNRFLLPFSKKYGLNEPLTRGYCLLVSLTRNLRAAFHLWIE